MNNLSQILEELKQHADEAIVLKKEKKWGVKAVNTLGVHLKEINAMAKVIAKNETLAQELIDTGIYEARLLASKIFPPKKLTKKQAESWVLFFDNWEICDSFCMAVFARSNIALDLIKQWHDQSEEYIKRAAFATMAAYTMADKKAGNEIFTPFFDLIKKAADDDRIYVKKAVNWALRNIGKRNPDLKQMALDISNELLKSDHTSSIWIAKDAIKELSSENVRMSNYPRDLY